MLDEHGEDEEDEYKHGNYYEDGDGKRDGEQKDGANHAFANAAMEENDDDGPRVFAPDQLLSCPPSSLPPCLRSRAVMTLLSDMNHTLQSQLNTVEKTASECSTPPAIYTVPGLFQEDEEKIITDYEVILKEQKIRERKERGKVPKSLWPDLCRMAQV